MKRPTASVKTAIQSCLPCATTRLPALGSCDLYYTHFDGEKYTLPVNMGPRINTPPGSRSPAFCQWKKLLFSSNRKGSYGGSDLWMVQKDKRRQVGCCGQPGPCNQHPGQEESPFYTAMAKPFISDPMDIPVWEALISLCRNGTIKKKEWSEPVNLGYPINSEGDEAAWPLIIWVK